MEAVHGEGRGSYLWGRSVHNVHIERLWADVTAQIGATWADIFLLLINDQLRFFMEVWNQHQIRIRDGPSHSPADMFGFDMFVYGVCETNPSQPPQPQEQDLTLEELEVHEIDWEALRDDSLLESCQDNNPSDEGFPSWIGHQGPPEHLNEVPVEAPAGPFSQEELEFLDTVLDHLAGAVGDAEVIQWSSEALIVARQLRPDLF
ncbi:hypothetical protein B0H15DRAFT_920416 [Mycena belliarum]|uniref:Integrase core domain-containing protein n=1 Tax=Mycena belliarum TaxID=1033014 RepID=A0AAD6UJD0_9AGAR|nr:hypothetical protein B0H15DRAFT_920416 [Mycena belliae]